MTFVALGLLLGMVGLLWMMGVAIMEADHQTQHQRSQDLGKPLLKRSLARVAVAVSPTPLEAYRISRKLFQEFWGFYTVFTFCRLL